MQINTWRTIAFRVGVSLCLVAFLLIPAFLKRAAAIGGFWNHLDEANRWIRGGMLLSLLGFVTALFGRQRPRILFVALSALSLLIWLGFGMDV